MKAVVLLLLLSFPCALVAKDRQWQDAQLVDIASSNGGAAAMPLGTMVVAVPIVHNFYWYETSDTIYACSPGSGKLLNVTLHGHNQFAVEGLTAHILDDSGKEIKLKIVQKIARRSQSQ
jgi:hypothetical protein